MNTNCAVWHYIFEIYFSRQCFCVKGFFYKLVTLTNVCGQLVFHFIYGVIYAEKMMAGNCKGTFKTQNSKIFVQWTKHDICI